MKKSLLSIMAAALVWGTISAGSVVQASGLQPSPEVFIDSTRQDDVLTLEGRTLVQLVAFNDPTWVNYSYDKKKKTINITNKAKSIDIQLTADKKEALVNGNKKTLDVPVTIRNGRTYVPLRFLSEQLGGSVYYHKQSKNTIVQTPSRMKQVETLMSGDLADARRIATSLPVLREKGALEWTGEGFTSRYIFPEGESLRFIREYKGLREYIEFNEHGFAEVKWAKDMYDSSDTKNREWGTKPAAFGNSVYFTDILMMDTTEYGKINSSGDETQLGRIDRSQPENKNKIIVPIEGEKRKDAK
ncbi:copper amine oxidase N-terminal domain-containing protein [Paenibacillus sp. SC116]|uniref:copper amine oxidase N-terminal domain-containing protein n=1 Tax=Paenibacillus sp. SC116 TaxID=2968986 RepID=UPI00215AE195|nr:copper amine oxidase N-terminal domain-containing protein [Paenibacillus sp. SC116]MCR8842451.1 copper amine oxidase N-terminal domain-containing protein [Paenibacillus sp. SC116]